MRKSLSKSFKLPKYMTTVTPFSKIVALIMYIVLPILGFYLGVQYQQMKEVTSYRPTFQNTQWTR